MKFTKAVLFVSTVFVCTAPALAQTISLSPPGLSSIPKGATQSNPYWQNLLIELTQNPSAGNTITISLPAGVEIADTNADSNYVDEVSVVDAASNLTGYRSVDGTTASRIVLLSSTGGAVASVHVQFPVVTQSAPQDLSVIYGKVDFSNEGEVDIAAGSLSLAYVEAHQLALATFSRLFIDGVADTTTNTQGDVYPTFVANAFDQPLADLISDRAGSLSNSLLDSTGVAFLDGDDANDVNYLFWFSKTDSLSLVDSTLVGTVVALDQATTQSAQANEGGQAAISFDMSSLVDTTYYLYLTSNVTGKFPLARSRGIAVRHQPAVLTVGEFENGNADFIDSGLLFDYDTGQIGAATNARSSISIGFTVVDFNDTAAVHLFYSAVDSLKADSVQTSGAAPNLTVTGLQGGVDVDSSANLREGVDNAFNWQIFTDNNTFVAEGNYYIYAVANDGTNLSLKRSDYTYNVRHSPQLVLDARQDQDLNTGGETSQRYYAITWNSDNGVEGDRDPDDSAQIALYYSVDADFQVPGGGAALIAAAADSSNDTHLIVSGLGEDGDEREDNQYIWDLWTHVNSDGGGGPLAAVPYYIYGITTADSTQRVVRWEDEVGSPRQLVFTHDSHLRINDPLDPRQVDGRKSFEVSWLSNDVDDNAHIWILLTRQDAGLVLGGETTYADIVADTTTDWMATSSDGSLAAATPLDEDVDSRFAVRPARLVRDLKGTATPLVEGSYYAYIVIDPSRSNPPVSTSRALQAPGLVTINALGADGAEGLVRPTIELVPADFQLMVSGDTALVEIRPNTDGKNVDLISLFASLDTTYLRVVDQDTAKAGIQPFAVDSTLSGLTLVDTLKAGADSTTAGKWLLDLVYFEQAGSGRFDGDAVLATIELVSKDILGSTVLDIDHFGVRQTAFYLDGETLTAMASQEVGRVQILERATISGRIQLQGRTNHQTLVTLSLRDRNQFLAITDSLFLATNDGDTTVVGIQDTTGTDGSFTLTQVPTGDYHLAIHVDRFLDGQYLGLRVNPGDQFTDINPTFRDDGITDGEFLIAGDVTGYVDTSGTSIPDNEIDQLDVDFVVTHFGKATSPSHVGRLADIDGDSLVWVSDLNVVAANFGQAGVQPVFKAVPHEKSATRSTIALVPQWGTTGELVVDVVGRHLEAMRAFGFKLNYDAALMTLEGNDGSEVFAGMPAVFAQRSGAGELALAGALMGPQAGVSGEGRLARLRFLTSSETDALQAYLQLSAVELVDETHKVTSPEHQGLLPQHYQLSPNFPNPFNPQTAMRFTLPQSGQVSLKVFDLGGQVVRVLVAQNLSAGVHNITWDGRDNKGHQVASGTYFARLRSGSFSATRKMMLVR
jgi:hypothetical protein